MSEQGLQYWPGGELWTDASVGDLGNLRRIRRRGCGIAILVADDRGLYGLRWGAFGLMPGPIHTVPTAELFAIVVATENVCPGGELTVTPDSEVNIKLYNKDKTATVNETNYDLLSRLRAAAAAREAPLHIRWAKVHGTEEHLRSGLISHEDLVGNAAADALSGLAADKAQVTPNDAQRFHGLALGSLGHQQGAA